MNLILRFVAWLLLIVVSTSSQSWGHDTTRRRDTDHNDTTANFESVAEDVVIARPCWLVATVVGAGLFIVALPVAAMSKSVNKTARTLVVKPAHATFTRPLGDFSTID